MKCRRCFSCWDDSVCPDCGSEVYKMLDGRIGVWRECHRCGCEWRSDLCPKCQNPPIFSSPTKVKR